MGDSFFFLDYIDDVGRDGFNDRDFYAEWYPTLSFGKLAKKEVRVGPIRDFALIAGGGPKTGNSFMFDVSWLLPIVIGVQSFAFTGHAEYVGGRANEFGKKVKGSILAQPQFVWDIGKAMAGEAQQYRQRREHCAVAAGMASVDGMSWKSIRRHR